jgi:predicted amidohydrolase
MVRIGAAQPRCWSVDYRLKSPTVVLARVKKWLGELEQLVQKAGEAGCDVLALPEDTPGLIFWAGVHEELLPEVLPAVEQLLLQQLGSVAAAYHMYLIYGCDTLAADGSVYNTAFFLGRDGKEIGRYHKVNMPISELNKKRGECFPVFETPDLGGVGLLICYDMVFPEAARCLALGGADIIFHITLGGAAIGDGEISRAAFRTRAVENFVYLVVSHRGGGSMIISPKGKVLAESNKTHGLVIADINPFGGREGSDATDYRTDMRARLFRERWPQAFGILTAPHPPVLSKVPDPFRVEEAVRIASEAITFGAAHYRRAEKLLRNGKTQEAMRALQKLQVLYPGTWVARASKEKLEQLLG